MATEDITPKNTPVQDVASDEDTAPVAQSEELSKGELEEVSGGRILI